MTGEDGDEMSGIAMPDVDLSIYCFRISSDPSSPIRLLQKEREEEGRGEEGELTFRTTHNVILQ